MHSQQSIASSATELRSLCSPAQPANVTSSHPVCPTQVNAGVPDSPQRIGSSHSPTLVNLPHRVSQDIEISGSSCIEVALHHTATRKTVIASVRDAKAPVESNTQPRSVRLKSAYSSQSTATSDPPSKTFKSTCVSQMQPNIASSSQPVHQPTYLSNLSGTEEKEGGASEHEIISERSKSFKQKLKSIQ